MFSLALVCSFVSYWDYAKSTRLIFTKFGGPQNRQLDFGDNLDHVTLGFKLGLGLQLGGVTPKLHMGELLPAICVIVTIMRNQQQRYVLY